MTEEQTDNSELTEEQKEAIKELYGYGGQITDGKHNVHTFLNNVVSAEDTLRLGNLTDIELGNLEQPVRALQELSLFSKDIMNNKNLADYFNKQSEIITRSSLSKKGFLVSSSITSKKESTLADMTPKERKENPSWFKKKSKPDELNISN